MERINDTAQNEKGAHGVMNIEALSVKYGKKTALDGVSFTIRPRGITAVIGPSGCGKTTLLHCMNGMLRENKDATISGHIYLGGKDTAIIPMEELRRRVGLVFQTPSPFPFSIYKNMTYGLKYYGTAAKADMDRAVEEKLRIVGLYDEVKDELGKNALKLSGGQQQRLCIARALTVEPEILLLDEPCSALDVKATALIEDMLLRTKRDYTIVTVTHNIAQAKRIADDVAVMFDGRLIEYSPAQELFSAPKQQLTREFLAGIYG